MCGHKKRAMIEIKPRFKIQYPMKNRYKNISFLYLPQYPFKSIKAG